MLQRGGILAGNPSRMNLGGAFSVYTHSFGIDAQTANTILRAASGASAHAELDGFREGVPPESHSLYLAAQRIEALRADGRLIGSHFDTTPPSQQPPESLREPLQKRESSLRTARELRVARLRGRMQPRARSSRGSGRRGPAHR